MKDKQEIGIIGMPAFKRKLFTNVVLVTAINDAVMRPICNNKAPEPVSLSDIPSPFDLSDIIKPFPRPMNRRERRKALRLKK